jgi:hypothetical protein
LNGHGVLLGCFAAAVYFGRPHGANTLYLFTSITGWAME